MRGMVATAVQHQDPQLLGRAATLSAHVSQRHLPKACFEFVIDLVHRHGALGLQVAHSGTLYGIVLDAQSATVKQGLHAISAELQDAGFQDFGVYSINGPGGIDVH